MRPSKCDHNHEHNNITINGPRPSPLKINKGSHSIHKQQQQQQQQQQVRRNQPVIIYTESPKVIYTKAKDFMTLVQRLTGLSSSSKDHNQIEPSLQHGSHVDAVDESRSSDGGDTGRSEVLATSSSSNNNNPTNFGDHEIPIFTSNCSPMNQFRLQDSTFPSPNMVNSLLTPSFIEFMKRLT